MIRGRFKGPNPTVTGVLSYPDLDLERRIEIAFLLDTGAHISVVHPFDTGVYLGVAAGDNMDDRQIASFANAVAAKFATFGEKHAVGIGGGASYHQIEATIQFRDDRKVAAFRLPVLVARPTPTCIGYPSFLGMDFLTYFDVHLNHPADVVELDFIGV